jgi:hypothetical protein
MPDYARLAIMAEPDVARISEELILNTIRFSRASTRQPKADHCAMECARSDPGPETPVPSNLRHLPWPAVGSLLYCSGVFTTYLRLTMKKLSALIAMTLFSGFVYAQAPVKATTTSEGTVVQPASKGDIKAAAKVEKAEIKANEKIEKAVADAAVTNTKADAKAAKTKAAAQAKADKKILDAKKDVAEAQVDANTKMARDSK